MQKEQLVSVGFVSFERIIEKYAESALPDQAMTLPHPGFPHVWSGVVPFSCAFGRTFGITPCLWQTLCSPTARYCIARKKFGPIFLM